MATQVKNIKVLIAEDDKYICEMYATAFMREGFKVYKALEGRSAIEKYHLKQPDIILLDIALPKMGGYEVAKNLRLREEFKHTSIIALTAHAMKGDEEKALQAGFNGYISKPINVLELPEQIEYYTKKIRVA